VLSRRKGSLSGEDLLGVLEALVVVVVVVVAPSCSAALLLAESFLAGLESSSVLNVLSILVVIFSPVKRSRVVIES